MKKLTKRVCNLLQKLTLHIFMSFHTLTEKILQHQICHKYQKNYSKRAKELRDLAEKQHNKFLVSQIGTTQKVLVENNSVGHSTNFSKIKLKEHVEACTIVSTKILEIN